MGWSFKSNEKLKIYERAFSKPVIEQILIEKTAVINNVSEDIAKHAVELLLQNLNNPIPILGNEAFLDKLVSGVTLSINNNDIDLHFIDFENNNYILLRKKVKHARLRVSEDGKIRIIVPPSFAEDDISALLNIKNQNGLIKTLDILKICLQYHCKEISSYYSATDTTIFTIRNFLEK